VSLGSGDISLLGRWGPQFVDRPWRQGIMRFLCFNCHNRALLSVHAPED